MQMIKFDEQGDTPGPIDLPFSCTETGETPGNIADETRVLAIYQANGYVLYEGDPEYNPETHRLGDYYLAGGVGKRYLVQLTPEELAVKLAEAKAQALEQVKTRRQTTLDALARSAGVSAIYDENRHASEMILAGQGESALFGGVTATKFATDAGAKLGMNAATWAAFIKGENDRARLRGKRIEEGYLHYYYGVIPAVAVDTRAAAAAAAQGYQEFCAALVAAADSAAILAVVGP